MQSADDKREVLKKRLLAQIATYMSDEFLDICGKRDNTEWFLFTVKQDCERMVKIWYKDPTVWDARMEAAMTGIFLAFQPGQKR